MAAAGLRSPLGTKCLGQVKKKEDREWGQRMAVAVKAVGPERDHKRESLMGAFKALVKCLEFRGQIFINHLLSARSVLGGFRQSLKGEMFHAPCEDPAWCGKDGKV